MDMELEICLKCFANEHLTRDMKHIDQLWRSLQKQRIQNSDQQTVEQDGMSIEQKKNVIIENFLRDLNENSIAINRTRQAIINEFRRMLNNIKSDIDDKASVSTTKQHSQHDNDEMRIASSKIRRQIATIDSALAHVFNTIDLRNSTDSCSRIQQWLRQHYAYAIDFNRMADGSNDAGDPDIFSEKSALMKCILERAPLWHYREKIIFQFINQMNEDLNVRNHLMESLYRMTDVPSVIRFVRCYTEDRQKESHERRQQLLHKMELELEHQQIQQQTRATELVNALYQVSSNLIRDFELNKKVKKVFCQTEATKQYVPILIDHRAEKRVEDVSLMIRLEADYTEWITNVDSIQQRFCLAFSQVLKLPTDTLKLEKIEEGSVILRIIITAPYGLSILNYISGHKSDGESVMLNMQVIQECCASFDCRIQSIVFGECVLPMEDYFIKIKWNKMRASYSRSSDDETSFDALDQEQKDSLCSPGWKRFGLKVALNDVTFEQKLGSWHVAYYGTRDYYAPFILTSGLRISSQQYLLPKHEPLILLSPSIEYAAHPQNTSVWKYLKNDENCLYFQLVFQCLVNPTIVGRRQAETLLRAVHKDTRIDKNIPNEELEWIIEDQCVLQNELRDNIICYGLMVRVIDCEPRDLPILSWWKNTHDPEY